MVWCRSYDKQSSDPYLTGTRRNNNVSITCAKSMSWRRFKHNYDVIIAPCVRWGTQRTHDTIIPSLLRQDDVRRRCKRNNDVIIASCVRWDINDSAHWCKNAARSELNVSICYVGNRWGSQHCVCWWPVSECHQGIYGNNVGEFQPYFTSKCLRFTW